MLRPRQARKGQPLIARLLGLRVAALFALPIILFLASPASLSSAMSFTCLRDLLTIKSPFSGYLHEIWSSGFPTSQNLLLLANFVVFIALMSMRLRSAAAARNLKARKKKKLFELNRSEEDLRHSSRCGQRCQLDSVPPLIIDTSDIHASDQMAENYTNRVSAEAIMLQDDGEQRKGSELADLSARPPCHKQLQAARRMSCDHNHCCSATNSNSFCTQHNKLKSHVRGGRNSTSTRPSEQLNSNPQPISVTKSTTFHAQSPAIDPDCKETLLKSKTRVKSMDATNEPTNPDGGQTVNCRTGKRSSTMGDRPCRLRREPSITSQEELNARVESFISRFNQKVKIQRQQSLISFLQMINRGS